MMCRRAGKVAAALAWLVAIVPRTWLTVALVLSSLSLAGAPASQASTREQAEPSRGATSAPSLALSQSTAQDTRFPFTFGDSYPVSYATRILSGNFDAVPGPDLVVDDGTIWLNDGHGTFAAGQAVGAFFAFTVVDMDLDGFDDIVALRAGSGGRGVVTYHCNGDGTFTESALYPLDGNGIDGIASADVNDDGYPDILLAESAYDGLTVILTYAGQLGEAHTFPPGPGSGDWRYHMKVAVADFNNDGSLDVAVEGVVTASPSRSSISFYYGDGSGGFTRGAVQSFEEFFGGYYDIYPSVLASGDLDGDGWVDVVLPEHSSPSIWWNDQGGAFTDTTRQHLFGLTAIAPVTVTDLDGDGRLDIVGGNDAVWGVMYNQGGRTFEEHEFVPPGRCAGFTHSLAAVGAVDVDESGGLDLLGADEGALYVLRNRHGRSFAGAALYKFAGTPRSEAVDFDGKGRDDLLVEAADGVYLMRSDSDGAFTTAPGKLPISRDFHVVDLDGDGRTDLAWSDGETLHTLRDGTIAAAYPAGVFQTVGDFNADGLPDVVVRGVAEHELDLGICYGTGSGALDPVSWTDVPLVPPTWLETYYGIPAALAAPDVDGDGYSDLVLLREGGPDTLVVLLNDGSGEFAIANELPVLVGKESWGAYFAVSEAVPVDLDEDGNVDLLVGSWGGVYKGAVTEFRGLGDGHFELKDTHLGYETEPLRQGLVAAADLQGDGQLEILLASYQTGDGCVWLTVSGSPDQDYLIPRIPRAAPHVVVGDFDGSGWPDIAINYWGYSALGGGILVILNDKPPMDHPPDCSAAVASKPLAWPPSHALVPVRIAGVVDPDGDAVTITATSITQDEPLARRGKPGACADGKIDEHGTAWVRMERDGSGNGRVYRIGFTATDVRGLSSEGAVTVCVPHDHGHGSSCVDDGQRFNSLACGRGDLADAAVHTEIVGAQTLSLTAKVRDRTISFDYMLPAAGGIDLSVFDVAGRHVATVVHGPQGAGAGHATWEAHGLPQGLYFARLWVGERTLTRTCLVLQ